MEAHADEAGVTLLLLGGVGLTRARRSGVACDASVEVAKLGEEGFLFPLLLVVEALLHALAIKASLVLLLPFLVAQVMIRVAFVSRVVVLFPLLLGAIGDKVTWVTTVEAPGALTLLASLAVLIEALELGDD